MLLVLLFVFIVVGLLVGLFCYCMNCLLLIRLIFVVFMCCVDVRMVVMFLYGVSLFGCRWIFVCMGLCVIFVSFVLSVV